MDIPEPELQIKMEKYLSKYFGVYPQVWSTDGTSRIDIVVIHKSDDIKKYPIGIEIKTVSKKRGKDLADWLKQATRYTTKDFIGFGKCLIITCPQVSGYYLREGEYMHQHETNEGYGQANNVSTFLGQFSIGEFQKYFKNNKPYYRIVFSGQVIWESRYDSFRINNYERLCRM